MNANKYIDQAHALYLQALKEAKEILKGNKNGSFIAVPDFDDEVSATGFADASLEIWAVGVNAEGHLVVKAFEVFPDESVEEWLGLEWFDIEDGTLAHRVDADCFPDLYRFVVTHLDRATSQAAADAVNFDLD